MAMLVSLLAGCTSNGSNPGTDDSQSGTDDSREDADDDLGRSATLYMRMVAVDEDPGTVECLDQEDERIQNVELFEKAFEKLESEPPEDTGYAAISDSMSPPSPAGSESREVYDTILEEVKEEGWGVERNETRVPCVVHDEYVISLEKLIESEA